MADAKPPSSSVVVEFTKVRDDDDVLFFAFDFFCRRRLRFRGQRVCNVVASGKSGDDHKKRAYLIVISRIIIETIAIRSPVPLSLSLCVSSMFFDSFRATMFRSSRRKTRRSRLGTRKKKSPKCSKKAVKKASKSKAPPICLA